MILRCPTQLAIECLAEPSSTQPQLEPDCLFNGLHFSFGQFAHAVLQANLAHGCQLIGHRLVFLPAHPDVGLAWVEPIYIAREGYNLNAIEMLVGCIVAHDNRGSFLADLAADRRLKVDPPVSGSGRGAASGWRLLRAPTLGHGKAWIGSKVLMDIY